VEKYERDASLVTLLFVTSAQFLIHFGIVTTALVGSYQLCMGDVSAILFFGYLILISRVYRPLDSELNNLESLIRSEDSMNRMREMDDYPKQVGTTEFEPNGYDICFENVRFAYSSETEVLNDISFTAKQGEITAIVGPSGGGKSTVARLASRFRDVDSGRITVGGVDISSVDPEVLLSKYSIVFQDVVLFNNTVMENIRVGKKNATDEEVIAAAQAAMCQEFVDNLPKGYDTMIGENGMKLSGGERQRISIARAILKNAPIILLDEATASLDAECETKVQAALSTLIVGKTVLVVAHRMRTIEGADKIVVLQDGTIKEQGMPEELMASDGAFARMCHLQHSSGDWMIHN
jgi:ATP-binding cassette subfamily B protein